MKKLAVGSWAFTMGPYRDNPVSLHTLLHRLEDTGYDGVELAAIAPHPTPNSHAGQDQRAQVRKELADHGLAFSGLYPDLRAQKLVSAEDCGPYVAAFEHHVPFAADLGIDVIRVDTAEPADEIRKLGLSLKTAQGRAVQAFDRCSRVAAHRGLRVAWGFDPSLAIHTPSEIVAVADAVRGRGNSNFGVLFDTCHAHICAEGSELELLRALRGKIMHVHLSDTDGSRTEGGKAVHMAPGSGHLNFDLLIPELLQSSVPDDWWVVDLGYCPEAWEAIGDAKRFLDRMRKKYAAG